MTPIIAPSVLSADFANLQRDVEMLNQSNADWIHVDIMDGVFVPNLSFGLPVTAAIKKHAQKPLDVHLMIVEPEKYIEAFRQAGADYISVHVEACPHLHRTLQQIRETGAEPGVAINPHTPNAQLENVLDQISHICLMSVNPGFGGQKFIENTYRKVNELKEMIVKQGATAKIQIDGGVDDGNAQRLLKAGADILVAGSFVFKHANPFAAIDLLKGSAR